MKTILRHHEMNQSSYKLPQIHPVLNPLHPLCYLQIENMYSTSLQLTGSATVVVKEFCMEYNKKRTTVKTTVVRRVKRQGSLHFQEKPDDNRVSCPLSFHINYKVNGQLQLTE